MIRPTPGRRPRRPTVGNDNNKNTHHTAAAAQHRQCRRHGRLERSLPRWPVVHGDATGTSACEPRALARVVSESARVVWLSPGEIHATLQQVLRDTSHNTLKSI